MICDKNFKNLLEVIMNNKYTAKNRRDDLFNNLWTNKTRHEVYKQMSIVFGNDINHANRLYDYFINDLFLPSSPIIACVPFINEPLKGLPISCFLSETNETGLYSVAAETAYISAHSGGLGTCWNKTPSVHTNKNGGVVAQVNVQGKIMKYCGGVARKVGSMCAWLRVDHADIEQFIDMRMNKSGVDVDLLTPRYIHHGIIFTNDFMNAAINNQMIPLIDFSANNKIIKYVNARTLFDNIMIIRAQTGEPLIMFEDNCNKALTKHHAKLNLSIKTTNLCTEITLPTGMDHLGNIRTAVCCLSSLNLEKYDIWNNNDEFFMDIAYFMDNVLTYFNIIGYKYKAGDIITEELTHFASINRHLEQTYVNKALNTNHSLKNAIYSAFMSRDVGIGVVGLQSLFQKENIAVENNGILTSEAKNRNIEVFKNIYDKFDICNIKLGHERGACQDIIDAKVDYVKRFSYMLAIAPTTVISALMQTSQGIQFDPPVYVYKNQTISTSIYNERLEKILIQRNLNTLEVWQKLNNGEYIDILSKHEYEVFKGGAFINQMNILEMAADRTKYIDQAQSINLAIGRDITGTKPLRNMVIYAWKNNIKTLYYQFSQTIDTITNILKESVESVNTKTECDINEDCSSCAS